MTCYSYPFSFSSWVGVCVVCVGESLSGKQEVVINCCYSARCLLLLSSSR
jgi:hypothetical protein